MSVRMIAAFLRGAVFSGAEVMSII